MNVYFLVEGKHTERKVYPAWLGHLVPGFTKVDHFHSVIENNYFLVSGEGYPSLFGHLQNAIEDFNNAGNYSLFVIALDVDDSTPEDRVTEVVERATANGLNEEQLRVIPQNCCIESWFLGNQRMIPRNPQSQLLAQFIRHYDVRQNDPELMPIMNGFKSIGQFHDKYFREVARARNLRYSKTRPGHVMDLSYVEELKSRVESTSQMATLSTFFSLCDEISEKIS
ncbi:MAG: hypothetical protein COA78_10655 [Blastopirellula sp.]|nr:MAG: hypothetical protein COA78_10655 [Blastopirellula sp.]